jgi:hypothetical protein
MRLESSKRSAGARRTRTGLLREREEEDVSFELSPEQLARLVICPSCQRLREVGTDRPERQRCRCEPRPRNEPIERREYWSLCSCCGIEIVLDGVQWATLQCDACRPHVVKLNRAMGRCVIPIGRHTAMNQVEFRVTSKEPDPVMVKRFANRMLGFFAAVDQVDKWSQTVVRENLAALGFLPGRDVRLSDYLEAGRDRIDKQRAFERLCEHFASRN